MCFPNFFCLLGDEKETWGKHGGWDENFSKFIEMLEAQDKKRDKKGPSLLRF
jgi:hypothetical protein